MKVLNATGLPFHHRCKGCQGLLQVEAGDIFRKQNDGTVWFRCIKCEQLDFVFESTLGQGALIYTSEKDMLRSKKIEQIKAAADYVEFKKSR